MSAPQNRPQGLRELAKELRIPEEQLREWLNAMNVRIDPDDAVIMDKEQERRIQGKAAAIDEARQANKAIRGAASDLPLDRSTSSAGSASESASGSSSYDHGGAADGPPRKEPTRVQQPEVESHPAELDQAIIISISGYKAFGSLGNASSNGRLFLDWLLSPSGGGLPAPNVKVFESDERTEGDPTEALEGRLKRMLERAAQSKSPLGRRLYIHLSGFIMIEAAREKGVFLVLPASSSKQVALLAVGEYVEILRANGSYQEIVFVVDGAPFDPPASSRVTLRNAFITPRRSGSTTSSYWQAIRLALMPGTSPSERSSNPHFGELTRLVVNGLNGGASFNGVVNSESLMEFVDRSALEEKLEPLPEVVFIQSILFAGRFNAQGKAGRRKREPGPLPPPVPPSAPKRSERVPTYDDNAAFVDELGRDAFAEVVAKRIEEAYEGVTKDPKRNGAIMVHLFGRWGSGKSSVLNFLKSKLTDDNKNDDDDERVTEQDWVVVDFNAWQHQRMPSPWWPLLRTIYKRCVSGDALGQPTDRGFMAWWRWQWARLRRFTTNLRKRTWRQWNWRLFKMRWAQPIALVAFLLAGGFVLLAHGINDIEMKIASGVLGLVGAVAALLKSPTVFSSRAGQELDEMRVNKQDLIKKFFEDIIGSVKRPIIVFIDDLDRCNSAYVVELLEGVQTLFKGAPVVYVVAADRDWIRKSFEEGYKDFVGTIGAPGRPLGHLFLEKMFQISAGIPRIGPDERERYWNKLLEPSEVLDRDNRVQERRDARAKAEEDVLHAVSMEEINELVKAAHDSGNTEQAQALSEAGAIHIASVLVEETTQHRLTQFAALLEPNPRAMKRLVNAYGMNQASLILQQRKVDTDALARWTILEMRWPLFAEVLAQDPELVENVHNGLAMEVEGIAKETNALSKHPYVRDVVGREGEVGRLTPIAIRSIVGDSVSAEKLSAKEAAPPSNTGATTQPQPPSSPA